MKLLDLPVELLLLIPQYLRDIEDFNNVASSCSILHDLLPNNTYPNTILRLAAASSRVFFRPDPHFLVAATARQIGQWALLNNTNYEDLREAFRGGMESLLALCVSKCGLTMDDIRYLHRCRFTTINPATDMIDRCAGKQWYDVPDFWDGGRSDAATIDVEPERSLFQIIIYGELFSSTMDAVIQPISNMLCFDLEMRLEFIKYCIPDYMCWIGYDGEVGGNAEMHVLPVGPYTPTPEVNRGGIDQIRSAQMDFTANLTADQVGLDHILGCRTWREAWKTVRHQIGPDFDEEWKQKMWHSAVQLQGLSGLEMLRPNGVEKWEDRLQNIYCRIAAMEPDWQPRIHLFGRRGNEAYDAPCMAEEVRVCMAGLWPSWS